MPDKERAKGAPTVAQYLAFQLEATNKTQREIADEVGYSKPNIITMFKQGLTKVPIPSAPKLARAIGVDPAYFLRMCLNEYMPELLETIEKELGGFCTKNETEILKIIRDVTKGSDPEVRTKQQREAIVKAAKALLE